MPVIEEIMERIKKLNEYEVTREMPEEFAFNGTIPFDIKIKNGIGTFKVIAVSMNEAEERVSKYLKE